jgi:S1-C subfamily serine protease
VWPIALVAGVVGAALCAGALAVTGQLSEDAQHVVEKVAVTPVLPTPFARDTRSIEVLKDHVGPAVVHLVVQDGETRSHASGVVYRDDGTLITSAHAVAGATDITVVLADGRRVEGELVGADLPTDVAVVSIDADGLVVAVLGTSDDLEAGTAAIAIGTTGDGEATVATGVVSAIEQRLDLPDGSLHGLIQTDVPVGGAWSGGPLVDESGAVIGITAGGDAADGGFGFATPIDLVKALADELIASGTITHGWLGIEGADLADTEAKAMELDGGATVRRVMAGSPASDSGLAEGDVITEIGDHDVDSSSDLVVALRGHKPGETVMIGYWRDGHHAETPVTIGVQP